MNLSPGIASTFVIAGSILAFANHSLAFASNAADPRVWRNPNHDAVNCLYLFAGLHGVEVEYGSLVRHLVVPNGASLAAIRDTAQSHGVDADIFRTNLEGLKRLPRPVIVHLDHDRSSAGEFVVLLSRTDDSWTTIRGAEATIEEMSHEEFRRRWSGYVLAPSRPSPFPTMLVAAVGGLVAGYWMWRGRPESSPALNTGEAS